MSSRHSGCRATPGRLGVTHHELCHGTSDCRFHATPTACFRGVTWHRCHRHLSKQPPDEEKKGCASTRRAALKASPENMSGLHAGRAVCSPQTRRAAGSRKKLFFTPEERIWEGNGRGEGGYLQSAMALRASLRGSCPRADPIIGTEVTEPRRKRILNPKRTKCVLACIRPQDLVYDR